jgi:hypothetical protein
VQSAEDRSLPPAHARRSARQHASSRARDVEDTNASTPPSAALLISDNWDDDVALLTKAVLDDDPRHYSEAVRRLDSADWHSAMQTEFDSLMKNHTWGKPVELPPGANLIGCGWVYKTKRPSCNITLCNDYSLHPSQMQ